MDTKEFFEALQSQQFNCYTFMALAMNRRTLVSKVLRVLTDSELEKLTNSFENELATLQQLRAPKQEWQSIFMEYQSFTNKQYQVKQQRKSPYTSCSSELTQLLYQRYSVPVLILFAVNSSIQSSDQPFHTPFWIAFSLISSVFLLTALDIFFKWRDKENSVSYEARLQERGLLPRIKGICQSSTAPKVPNRSKDLFGTGLVQQEKNLQAVVEVGQQQGQQVVVEVGQQQGQQVVVEAGQEVIAKVGQDEVGEVEEKKGQRQEQEEKMRRVSQIELAGMASHNEELTKSFFC